MSRALLIIEGPKSRAQAAHWCQRAPIGTRVEFKEAKRSTDQNSKLWACLTEIARQCPWHGVRLSADDWKLIFLDSLKSKMRLVPNIAGNGFVNLGRSSSDLSVGEFSDLLELVHMFAAAHGITLGERDPDLIDIEASAVRSLPAPEPATLSRQSPSLTQGPTGSNVGRRVVA